MTIHIRQIASNMTEVHTPRHVVLFSFETPVAALNVTSGRYYVTRARTSPTTAKHITKWLPTKGVAPHQYIEQREIERIASERRHPEDLVALIDDVLHANESRALDDDGDRRALRNDLVRALREAN